MSQRTSSLFAFAISKQFSTRSSMETSQLHQSQTSSEFDKDYTKYQKVDDSDDAKARSDFGTKWYWDSMLMVWEILMHQSTLGIMAMKLSNHCLSSSS